MKRPVRDCMATAALLIKPGYLTPPERLDMPVVQYDLPPAGASNGLFSEADLTSS